MGKTGMGRLKDRELMVVDPGDPTYQAALALEATDWADPGPNPQDHPLRRAYENEVVTGDSARDALSWLSETYGPFDKCCSLGCGTGRIESELLASGAVSRMFACDASQAALERFMAREPRVVRTEVADLNFMELPENEFDLVIVWESLHHVINIEYILLQIARALKPNGFFLLRDFVGESRWRWSPNKRSAVNSVVRRIGTKADGAPVRELGKWLPVPISPFEAIRSSDIVGLVRRAFHESTVLERAWDALSHDALMVVDYRQPGLALDRAVGTLIDADREFGILHQPCTLLGLYRKPATLPVCHVRPWSRQEMAAQLDVVKYLPPGTRCRLLAKRWAKRTEAGDAVWRMIAKLLHGGGQN